MRDRDEIGERSVTAVCSTFNVFKSNMTINLKKMIFETGNEIGNTAHSQFNMGVLPKRISNTHTIIT